LRGCSRVCRTHVADDPSPIPAAWQQHCTHAIDQKGVVSRGGIVALTQMAQGDGPFGQALEYQEVELSGFRKFDGRVDAVTGKACSCADSYCLHLRSPPQDVRADFGRSAERSIASEHRKHTNEMILVRD
jgi:hypothetical protein